MNKYKPNGTTEDIELGILHSVGGYYVTQEKNKGYHVWVPNITHAVCDSAYNDISLAVARCNYLFNQKASGGIGRRDDEKRSTSFSKKP